MTYPSVVGIPTADSVFVSIKHTFVHVHREPRCSATGHKRRVTHSLPPKSVSASEVPDMDARPTLFDPTMLKQDISFKFETTSNKNPGSATMTPSEISSASSNSDPDLSSSDAGDSSSEAGELPSEAGGLPSEVEGPPPPPEAYGAGESTTLLNAAAQLYAPRGPVIDPGSSICKFGLPVASAVGAVKVALLQMGLFLTVDVCTVATGWSLVVHLRPELYSMREQVMSCAKEALLHAAEQSQNIYVVGYNARPFAQTPLGFKAGIAGMDDEGSACWDFYAKGKCWKGNHCRWKHPAFVSEISMSFVMGCAQLAPA